MLPFGIDWTGIASALAFRASHFLAVRARKALAVLAPPMITANRAANRALIAGARTAVFIKVAPPVRCVVPAPFMAQPLTPVIMATITIIAIVFCGLLYRYDWGGFHRS
jgi:hypothetical protein